MKVAVIGAGAMGCLYGGCLAYAGHDVTLVGGRSIPVIREKGLRMNTAWFGDVTVYPKACQADELEGKFDLIIALTKAYQLRDAMESIKHVLDDEVTVLSMINGLGNREVIADFVKPEQILIGMTLYPSDIIERGYIKSEFPGDGSIVDAFVPGVSERCATVTKALADAGITHINGEGAWEFIYEKVIWNCTMNTIAVVVNVTSGTMDSIDIYPLAYDMVDEGSAVARASGVIVDAEKQKKRMKAMLSDGTDHIPSMLADFVNGKKTEVENINGGLVAEGRKVGVPTPIIETMMRLVQLKERAKGKEYKPIIY